MQWARSMRGLKTLAKILLIWVTGGLIVFAGLGSLHFRTLLLVEKDKGCIQHLGPQERGHEQQVSISSQHNESIYHNFRVAISKILTEPEQQGHRDVLETTADATDMTTEVEFKRRAERVRKVCATTPVPGNVKGVFTNEKWGVLYCFAPKTGCTFWKRFFKAVAVDKNLTLASVFAKSRISVHFARGANGRPLSGQDKQRYPTRFMVTRDPFSRLLSSYLDKAYLPDFWRSETKALARKIKTPNDRDFLREHLDKLAHKFDPKFPLNTSSTFGDILCGKYLTFAEFATASLSRDEPHWMPIHMACNPCTLNVTHVNHMHTFTRDASAILSKMDLDHLLDGFDKVKQVNMELETILQYNFEKVFGRRPTSQRVTTPCISAQELAQRLWNNFQWRGYIHPHVDYVTSELSTNGEVKEDLRKQLEQARAMGLKSPALMAKYKHEFMSRAYSSLTKDTFEKIVKRFELDIKLFGYEEERDRLRTMYD